MFPDEVPSASSAGGFESYESDEDYREYALLLARDGEFILTDRTLIFVDGHSAVKLSLDRIESFGPTLRLERGMLRHVKVRMKSGQMHQIAAAATFVDEVLSALGKPNATDGLVQLAAGQAPLAKEYLTIGAPDGPSATDRYPVGTYDVLLMSDQLLGWTHPDQTIVIPLKDVKQWREAGRDTVSVQVAFKDGTFLMLLLSEPFARTIRKTARVWKRRLKD
ncbi:hypothetical protein ACIGN6_31845 [Streptomyces sp. NPDC053792]|uniref:hypothetical protein n=1 Tax=Streptomyces sp. NPDC053792 TaxID=3365716 RepID=UPI0037D0C459